MNRQPVWVPPPGARFLLEGTTRYAGGTVTVDQKPILFGSGATNRKLGGHIEKGPWAGMPIYMLTLEERRTCPPCAIWDRCYGNAMPWAKRIAHGAALEDRIPIDLARLERRHRRGFAMRLHQLGDFYSLDYVQVWAKALNTFPALHVFGYTAWKPTSEIGAAILDLTQRRWNRFAIRFSGTTGRLGTVIIKDGVEPPQNGIVCPEQLGQTAGCGSCALCWAPAGRDKTIVFIEHGTVDFRKTKPA